MSTTTYTVSVEVDTVRYPLGGGEFAGTLTGIATKAHAVERAKNLLGASLGHLRQDSAFDTAGASALIPDTAHVIKAWVHTYVGGSLLANSQEIS